MKPWISKAIKYLELSLGPIPQELNELDWKETLSPNNDKLCKHLSAFSNNPGGGFLVFGIDNNTGNIIGITKKMTDTIIDKLSSLCRDSLNPVAIMDHAIIDFRSKQLLCIYIKESAIKPVHIAHKSIEECYIRTGASSRKASRQEIGGLMLNSKTPVFEELNASKLKNTVEIIGTLDYPAIYSLLNKPIPSNIPEIINWLLQEKMVAQVEDDGFYITNFGALAAAQNLNEFDGLSRKSIRLIKYEGKTKIGESKEFPGNKGYAIGFNGLIEFIKGILPGSEIIKSALRKETSVYPTIAIRELTANTLIHQDFTIRGSGPMIEIFNDRIEFTNPGKLLPNKNIDRLIRTTPESRNEILASAFRRYNICEERGSGFEKAVTAIELYGLPPLKFEEYENAFKVTMYAPRPFAEMTDQERMEAAYQHSIIQYFGNGGMTNASLRQRFNMHDKQSSQISRLIKTAVEAGRIKFKDPYNISTKFNLYVPYWA
jgi:predicted HTH transcriptional regulator